MAKKSENKQTASANIEEKKTEKKSSGSLRAFFTALVMTLVICSGWLMWQNMQLTERLRGLEQDITALENNLSQNADSSRKLVDNNRKIYVFNMDETVKSVGLQEANQKFEDDIKNLDTQVKEAQATIKDIKDEKMKKKMLNLSIKPLEMKREDLLKEYSKAMQDSLAKINNALAEIATENNISVVFMNKAIAVNTNYVVDVTPQVVEKIKGQK